MKPTIAITMGDPAGIGPEIVGKLLLPGEVTARCAPIVIGDAVALSTACPHAARALRLIAGPEEAAGEPGVIDIVDVGALGGTPPAVGTVNRACGEAAFQYILRGIEWAQAGKVEAVVTGPISKEALHLAGHYFSGHTEIFSQYTNTKNYAMLLLGGSLRVIHVTTHVSMREACDLITKERVLDTIRLAKEAMDEIGVSPAVIGVAGLNAHCSENGLFGHEEAEAILPAIEAARAEGIDARGPVPPDTVFVKAAAGQYAVVVAMYHDQGHIPLKLHGFRMDPETGRFLSLHGVNTTVGLPIIRTSVDHGTAFDIAGKGIAREDSLLDAVLLACRMAESRRGRAAC